MAEWSSGYVTDLNYTHGFYRELTPSYLAMVPLIKGQTGFDPNMPLNICELGCGQGLSANLIAAANPQVQYYATDFNPAQIVGAQTLAREAEVSNVHFFDQSFAEFLVEPSLPSFDIIMLHGIYSWIQEEHRREIVEFIRRKLKPGGLVYISYNALPGWSVAAPMRQLMYMHGKTQGGTTASKLDPALEFVGKMIEVGAGYFRVNQALKDRFDKLKPQNRNYLAHEYLNEAWTLLYHSEVVEELQAAKLTYVGSAAVMEMMDGVNMTPAQREIIGQFTDPTMIETVRDFMFNQQFRRDVFMRGTLPLSKPASAAHWSDGRYVLSTVRSEIPLTAKGMLGELNLKAEVYGPVLDALANGAKTGRQLLADPKIGAIGLKGLIEVLIVLTGAGHLQPCLDEKGDAKRSQRTKAFNKAVMARSLYSSDLQFLASPLTGGGLQVDRFSQMFVLALQRKQTDPVKFVIDALAAVQERLLHEGKPFESEEAMVARVRELHEKFETKVAPVLKQMGII
jgi:SAM-dependent methyltransferase